MTRALLAFATLLSLLAIPERGAAISREEDIARDLNETFKAPSTFPPNPALRPLPSDNGRTLAPLGPNGPGPEISPEPAPARLLPFLVAIAEGKRSLQESYLCAGTRIAPQWVVTAAHCVFAWRRRWPVDPQPYVLFDTSRLSQPGPRAVVTKIVPHPAYNPRTLMNDIALLRIDTKRRDFGPPLKLDGPPIKTQSGQIALFAGWGVANLSLTQRQLGETQQGLEAVIRDDDCFANGNYSRLKGTGVFCAASLLPHHDTCYRFGGGPLILYDAKGVRYLGGIVSWPAVCPSEVEKTNVYLDVQHFVPWIKSAIQANGGPGE